MKKNILVLTGSPRKNGNTNAMVSAFKTTSNANGHEVTVFNTTTNRIKGCVACDTCWSKGTACSFTDGFTELEPLLEQADMLVMASPLYFFGFTSQLKAAIDKLYAYIKDSTKRPLKITDALLLTCGGTDDENEFSGLVNTYKHICSYLKWNNKGELIITKVNKIGDIDEKSLQKVESLAKRI